MTRGRNPIRYVDPPEEARSRRILMRSEIRHYIRGDWRSVGYCWVECWYDGKAWVKWCGDRNTKSTYEIRPVAWAECPEEDSGR